MSTYQKLQRQLRAAPRTWLVTGAAGFIGSHLVETLLRLNQRVVGIDNFASGKRQNLAEIRRAVSAAQWKRFRFQRGDITALAACRRACRSVDVVLHQAALGSVPRSIADPLASHAANVDGFLHMLLAARDAGVKRFVYASSSSVYGDEPHLPKREERTSNLLSPYAATKAIDEIYAAVFARCYGMETIGLRYFNVFGPRQDPDGPYAAVIPRWVAALLDGKPVEIFGDGRTSRDFCYVANAVQANLLAATTTNRKALNQAYNVAVHARTDLNELFRRLRDALARGKPALAKVKPLHRPFRAGDVRHSLADISKARRRLGYAPTHDLAAGLKEALDWYRGGG